MGEADFREALRLRLLLPVVTGISSGSGFQCQCGKHTFWGTTSDKHHALNCDAVKGMRIKRHTECVAILTDFARRCTQQDRGAIVIKEYVIPGLPADKHTRADAFIKSSKRTTVVDVAIVNPGTIDCLDKGSAQRAGVATRMQTAVKFNRYSSSLGRKEATKLLTPFVLEATGRLGHLGEVLVKELAGLLPHLIPEPDAKLKAAQRYLFRSIGCCIAKWNSRMVLAYRASGREVTRTVGEAAVAWQEAEALLRTRATKVASARQREREAEEQAAEDKRVATRGKGTLAGRICGWVDCNEDHDSLCRGCHTMFCTSHEEPRIHNCPDNAPDLTEELEAQAIREAEAAELDRDDVSLYDEEIPDSPECLRLSATAHTPRRFPGPMFPGHPNYALVSESLRRGLTEWGTNEEEAVSDTSPTVHQEETAPTIQNSPEHLLWEVGPGDDDWPYALDSPQVQIGTPPLVDLSGVSSDIESDWESSVGMEQEQEESEERDDWESTGSMEQDAPEERGGLESFEEQFEGDVLDSPGGGSLEQELEDRGALESIDVCEQVQDVLEFLGQGTEERIELAQQGQELEERAHTGQEQIEEAEGDAELEEDQERTGITEVNLTHCKADWVAIEVERRAKCIAFGPLTLRRYRKSVRQDVHRNRTGEILSLYLRSQHKGLMRRRRNLERRRRAAQVKRQKLFDQRRRRVDKDKS